MRRAGHLFEQLTSWPNLLRACYLASRRKRFRHNVASFNFDSERELLRLQSQLSSRTWKPGRYRTFTIYEPKQRLISAAPFRDRVVHHALCGVIEPLFEKTFVFDSYACRSGKGTHAAVRRSQHFARRFPYCLQADVRKFFPSVDHEILKSLVMRSIKDPSILWLVQRIVDSSNPQDSLLEWFPGDSLLTPLERRRGLPIGNQTSQFFANVYLNPLDHTVQDRLRAPAYVRYVDDLLVFANDKSQLRAMQSAIGECLGNLRLRLHPRKCAVFPTAQGFNFLGYRIFPTHTVLAKPNVKRFRRRLQQMQAQYAAGLTTLPEVRTRIVSWLGHANHARTSDLQARLFREFSFRKHPPNSMSAPGINCEESTAQGTVQDCPHDRK